MSVMDRQFLTGFTTAAQVLRSPATVFTTKELVDALNHADSRGRCGNGRGCGAWLAGYNAGIRSAFGLD